MKKKVLILLLFTILKVEAQSSTFSVVDSLFEKGRYKLALKKLKQIQLPSFLTNYKTAIIYESIDNYQQTAYFLEKALQFQDDEKAKIKLARAYQRLQQTHKAIKIYEEVVAKDPLNLVLKYQLGKLYLAKGNHKKAIPLFKKLIEQDVSNANYSYQLALAYAQKNDRDRMINSFIDTFKKDTTHLKAIAYLASSFHKLKDVDSTQLFVEKGLLLNKNHINLNKLKINQLYREEKYLESIPLLLNLDTIDKKDTYSISMLGRTYYNLDSLEQSKKYFKKLTRVDPENFKAFTHLGHIALKEKDYRTAWFSYQVATTRGKEKRDEEYYGLATMYYETNKPKQALVNFEKAYKENYKNYKALYQLATISDDYYKDKQIAYKYYKKYIETFEDKDQDMTNFIKKRIALIKEDYFMRGEKLDR
ncbi:tetratricopeptide repeat protein [Polaribacter aestuariivivens]|uniref:Tetratricopeptide repeat protein n=1 Tax=Polaribacter aestuariivivens TaxID=2304626 RepID=A0A5S3NAE5_9FLAO|nr:tetratricopeptide repeat protein [Polaribacter aestuariivivens]TMM32185.1 tetratricopeptide repeat protein [Polaribacter aestuariivivens]